MKIETQYSIGDEFMLNVGYVIDGAKEVTEIMQNETNRNIELDEEYEILGLQELKS